MEKYQQLPTSETVDRLVENLKERNFIPYVVNTKEEALAKLIEVIPEGAEIATGSSETIREIGLLDVLKQKDHKWENLKDNIFTEIDHLRKEELRRESVLADYNIQSLHAVTEGGQLLIASGMGNQISAIAYASKHLVFVVGLQKVVKSLDAALERLNDYVVPLENERMKRIGFKKGTTLGKWMVFETEKRKRDIHIILVNEVLGF